MASIVTGNNATSVSGTKATAVVTAVAIEQDRFKVNDVIEINSSIRSPNGKYKLGLEDDGNFVLHGFENRVLWSSRTGEHRRAAKGLLQDDGNLRLFDDSNREVWSSYTGGEGNASSTLIIQDDGNVVLYSDGQAIWSTDTVQAPEQEKPKPSLPTPTGPVRDRLKPGETLNKDQGLTSANGEYVLIMQGDGVLVIYKKNQGAIWARGGGAGNSAEKCVFRQDGELELLTWSGNQKWVSGTPGRGNSSSFLMLRDDANLVISTDGQIVWSSKTGPEIPAGKMDRIKGGSRLLPGEMLTSPNGKFTLNFQGDGNFVLYEGSKAKWSSGSSGRGGDGWVQVENEGNMAVFVDQRLEWSTRTRYRRNAGDVLLVLQDDGVAVLTLDGVIVWSTNSALVRTYEPRDFESFNSGDKLSPGQCLTVGKSLTSPNGKMSATLQANGQLVLLHNETKEVLYRCNEPSGSTPSKLTVGYNDDVIIWGPNGTKIWQVASNQGREDMFNDRDEDDFFHRPQPGSLALNDKGNINYYSASWPNNSIWTSGRAFPAFYGNVTMLKPGEGLVAGQTMRSDNGDHEFSLLPSGTLRIRNTRFNSSAYYFTTGADSSIQDARYFLFDRDMTVKIQGADGRTIFSSTNEPRDRRRPEPPRLVLDNDANVYVRLDNDEPWHIDSLESSPTLQRAAPVGDALRPGTTLGAAQVLRSNNGQYTAALNIKGEFALKKGAEQLWAKGGSADAVWLTADGNLCVGKGGNPRWQSNTGGRSGQGDVVLVVQDDGNMCVYAGGKATFATNTSGGQRSWWD